MRWSELPIQTLRDEPAEGDRRLRLLVRAAYMSYSGPLFLGEKAIHRIEKTIATRGLDVCELQYKIPDIPDDALPREVHTPGIKTIAEIAAFSGLPETSLIKSVVMARAGELILALVRGDHTLKESSLGPDVRAATHEEIRSAFSADPGSLGPVGLTGVRIVADEALRDRRGMICGANRTDYHLFSVAVGRDFEADFQRIRREGDGPGQTGVPIQAEGGALVGSVGAISAEQVLIELARQHRDEAGLVMPWHAAPFQVIVTPVNIQDEQQRIAAEQVYETARKVCDVLLDDRDLRPGVKFKDAELIGIPVRITIGKKLAGGMLEIQKRRGRVSSDIPLAEVTAFLQAARPEV